MGYLKNTPFDPRTPPPLLTQRFVPSLHLAHTIIISLNENLSIIAKKVQFFTKKVRNITVPPHFKRPSYATV